MPKTLRRGAHRGEGVLKVIATFKIVKALLLIAVGLGALRLLNPTTAEHARRWAFVLALRLGPRVVSALQNSFSHLQASRLTIFAILAFLYAALFTVEGIGLWLAKRWAEYLTIIATSSFVPFEIYELIHKTSWPRIATLAINLLVVAYLIWNLKETKETASKKSGR